MPKKPTRIPNPFDFCPKHGVFYKSCGCSYSKKSKEKEEIAEMEDTEG